MQALLQMREQPSQEQSNGGLTDRTSNKKSTSLPVSLNSSINLGILRYKERFLEEQALMQIKVRNVFNLIGDLNDKKQIQTAMKQLDSKEERSVLIDKILKRKQEKQDADEIMRMSKVQPLLTRFVRKLKKQSLAFQESKSHLKESTKEKIVHFDEDSSHPDSRRSSMHSPDEQQSQRSETIRTPIKKNSEASELENRAKFLSIFLNNKKKKEEPKEEKLNSISSVCELLMGKTDNLGKKINLNKVSEDSSDLINRGKELQKLKANELLREGQKQILASHFKSYSLRNRYNSNVFKKWTDDPNINTFHSDLNNHDHKIEYLKMKNFHNYQNLLDATKVVESDINTFLVNNKQEKGKSALDFVMLPSSIKDPTTRVIENRVRQMQVNPFKKGDNRTVSVNYQDTKHPQLRTKSHSRSVSSLKLQQDRAAPVSLAFILDNSQTPTTATNQHDNIYKAHDFQNILNSSICQSTGNQPYDIKDRTNSIIPQPFQSNPPISRNHNQNVNNNLTNHPKSSSNGPLLLYPIPTPIVISDPQSEIFNKNNQSPQRQRLPSKSTRKSNILLINNTSFTEKMQDMLSAVRGENNNNTIKDPLNNLDTNNHGSTTDRTHKRNPSSLLAPLTAHAKRNSSCVSFNFNYDFDKACQNQRDKTGVQKKQYFSYNKDNQDKVELQDKLLFSDSILQGNNDIGTQNDIGTKLAVQKSKQDFMRTLENNKLLNHALKNIKTVDKWKLQGDIKYQGAEDPEIMNDEEKDDESLVSFTEIKLDKMYKKTIALQQNNQRIIKKQEEQIKGGVDPALSANQVKTMNHLTQLKREVLHATHSKLRAFKRGNNLS